MLMFRRLTFIFHFAFSRGDQIIFPPMQKRRGNSKDVGGMQNKHWKEMPKLREE